MLGLPRRIMIRLAEAIMIASDALFAKCRLRPLYPRLCAAQHVRGGSPREGTTNGSDWRRGAVPPDPCEACQRSMLRWPGWRMRQPAEPLMSGSNNYITRLARVTWPAFWAAKASLIASSGNLCETMRSNGYL